MLAGAFKDEVFTHLVIRTTHNFRHIRALAFVFERPGKSSVSFASVTNALDCHNKHDIQNRVNHAVVANTNAVCVSSVHELATTGWARIVR
jgi:hypothetical protein